MSEPVMHRFAAQTTDGKGYSGTVEHNEYPSAVRVDAVVALKKIGVTNIQRLLVLYEGGKTK